MAHAHHDGCDMFDRAGYDAAIADSTPQIKTNARKVKRVDPTRTTGIQNEFARAVNRAFAELLANLRKMIVDKDAFGLKLNRDVPKIDPTLSPGAFAFTTDASKLVEFEAWLDAQVASGLLAVDSTGARLTDDYIRKGYAAGAKRAQQEAQKAGLKPTALELSLGRSVPAERVAALYVRTFGELRGLTEAMTGKMRRVLADGIAQGQGAKKVAREMSKVVEVSRKRALLIARTEVVRAHHTGNIAELKRLGVQQVKVRAEWKTAGDDRVCASCAGLEGRVFKVKRIEGLIPIHPACRCVALPLVENGLPPSGRPDPEFRKKTSDGKKREGDPNLYEKATGGAKKPGYAFPGQDPVTTNAADVAGLLQEIRETAGDAIANLLEAVTETVGGTLTANRALIAGQDGENGTRGPRGFIGMTGSKGKQGDKGEQGEVGPAGESVRGPRGFTGQTGEKGPAGERGQEGRFGMRGREGKQGRRGRDGRNGRDGKDGQPPEHELKLNSDGEPVSIRFQRPNGWGGWLKLNSGSPLPAAATGVRDLEIKGNRIRFLLPSGWTKWVRLGGGGGGASTGGLSTVETDETISGDGSESTPLKSYGVMNREIAESLTITSGQVMINRNIEIADGATVSADGEIYLI